MVNFVCKGVVNFVCKGVVNLGPNEQLGLFAEVEAHLVEALSHETDPWISQNRFVLQPILEQARAGQRVSILRIRCASPDAQVLMNGSAPVPVGGDLRVLAGSVTFVVRAPGFSDLERTVQLRAGATVIEEITLERIAETHANTTGIGQTSTAITGATGAAVDVAIVPPRLPVDRRATTLRTVGWVSAGGSAGFAVTGIIAQIVMMNAAYRWNSEEICGPDTQRPSTECLRDAQQARDMDVVRTIGFVGGGALAVAAVTLLVIPSVAPRDRAQVRCVPSFGSTVVTCGGVF